MADLVESLAAIPGVALACVYDAGAADKAAPPAGVLTPEAMDRIGRNLLKLAKMGRPHAMHIHSCVYRLDRYTVTGVPLEDNKLLLTICEPHVSSALIASTIERYFPTHDAPGDNFTLDLQVIDADQ